MIAHHSEICQLLTIPEGFLAKDFLTKGQGEKAGLQKQIPIRTREGNTRQAVQEAPRSGVTPHGPIQRRLNGSSYAWNLAHTSLYWFHPSDLTDERLWFLILAHLTLSGHAHVYPSTKRKCGDRISSGVDEYML